MGEIEPAKIVHQNNNGLTVFAGAGSNDCESHFSHVTGLGYHVSTRVDVPGVGRYPVHQEVLPMFGERQTTVDEFDL